MADKNFSVRVPEATQTKLDAVAGSLDRSRNWVVNEAIASYLSLYDWQKARIQERFEIAEKDGVFLSSQQVDSVVDAFRP